MTSRAIHLKSEEIDDVVLLIKDVSKFAVKHVKADSGDRIKHISQRKGENTTFRTLLSLAALVVEDVVEFGR